MKLNKIVIKQDDGQYRTQQRMKKKSKNQRKNREQIRLRGSSNLYWLTSTGGTSAFTDLSRRITNVFT